MTVYLILGSLFRFNVNHRPQSLRQRSISPVSVANDLILQYRSGVNINKTKSHLGMTTRQERGQTGRQHATDQSDSAWSYSGMHSVSDKVLPWAFLTALRSRCREWQVRDGRIGYDSMHMMATGWRSIVMPGHHVRTTLSDSHGTSYITRINPSMSAFILSSDCTEYSASSAVLRAFGPIFYFILFLFLSFFFKAGRSH